MDAQNYKICVQKFLIFVDFRKMRELFLLLFYRVQREDAIDLK